MDLDITHGDRRGMAYQGKLLPYQIIGMLKELWTLLANNYRKRVT
ncbi:MAG TPA: hypothetical protein PLF95_09580 [Bacteroidales bacterium]|jgi:hypothetical protein|nr:hypothetical protein [Bacteroidales bacterium]